VPLHDGYIWSVVILTTPDGAGRPNRPIGTAFAVEAENTVYLVTAKHVVSHGRPVLARARMIDGDVHDDPVGPWTPHDTEDVAVTPLSRLQEHLWKIGHVPDGSFLPKGPEDDQVMLGQEVLFIGLLHKLPAMAEAGIPMVRTGSLGRLNQEHIPVRVAPNTTPLDVTGHLVDSRAYKGMSGAPCFVQRLLVRAEPDRRTGEAVTLKTETYLLGVISAEFDDREQVEPVTTSNYGLVVSIHSGVSVVAPVRFLRELLESNNLAKARSKRAAEEAAQEEIGTEAQAVVDMGPTANLMGQVPKDEAHEVHRQH